MQTINKTYMGFIRISCLFILFFYLIAISLFKENELCFNLFIFVQEYIGCGLFSF